MMNKIQIELASPSSSQLWQEAALLEQLVYKNINQHRNTRPFQRLLEVRRLLRLAREADVGAAITALRDALTLSSRPTLTLHERSVPAFTSAVRVLRRLLGCCRLAEGLAQATLTAAAQFTTQLAQSFFMPLSLTCLAVLARVRALGAQLLLDCIKSYNSAVELLDYLPFQDKPAEEFLINGLPQMLKCSWTNGTPTLEEVPWPSSDLLVGSNDNRLRPQAIISIKNSRDAETIKGEGTVGGTAGDDGGTAVASSTVPAQLAVIEDRGVAITREELMAELRQGAAAAIGNESNIQPVRAAAIEQAPAYSRAEGALGASTAGKSAAAMAEKLKNKPRKGPRIKIVDDQEHKSGSNKADQKGQFPLPADFPADLNKPATAALKVGPISVLSALAPRSTAFISVESMQKKKEIAPAKNAAMTSAGGGGGGGDRSRNTGGGAEGAGIVSSSGGTKSWEDWLAPIGGGSSDKMEAPGQGKKSGKKRRR